MRTSAKAATVGIATIALLAIVAIPTIAAPASQTYQVAAAPNNVNSGLPVMITATVKQGIPNCAYAVTLSVTGPGTSATDQITVNTMSGGNGHTSVSFPANFTGTGSTTAKGTYDVTASFACNYVTGSASTTFTVFK